jgi:HlyD family secretion protein
VNEDRRTLQPQKDAITMKRNTLLVSAGIAAAAIGLLAWAFAPRPVLVELAPAERGRFESTIDEDARTRLRERFMISAPLAGRLARISLREGDAVAAGAVVARLSPVLSPLLDERTVLGQQARVQSAEAAVLRAGVRIERARVGLRQAENELSRSEQLAGKGFVAPTKLEVDRLAVAAARKEIEAAEQDRHVAGHDLEQARAALGAVRQAGSSGALFEVRSPIEGRVLRVAQANEAVVALGAPLLEIGDTRRLEVVTELLTTDALRVRPGARARIERWGGPGTLEGIVQLIEPAAFTKVSALGIEEQRVNVLLDITSPATQWAALGDAYRVSVRIVTLSVDDAVRVPVSAVFPAPSAGPDAGGAAPMAVFVVREGRARLLPIELGARNGVHAWVRAGLAPGDSVIVYPPPAVADGVRVKARGS